MLTNVEIANGYISQGWAVVPPLGSIVRVLRDADATPWEFRVDEVEIEVELDLSLCMVDMNGNGTYADPEDIIEFVSVPEEIVEESAMFWWRRPNRKNHQP